MKKIEESPNMKKIKILFISIISFFSLLFCSCDSSLTVTISAGHPSFSYNANLGSEFIKTVSTIMSLENSSEIQSFFEPAELEKAFIQAGFSKVSARMDDKNKISVDFSPSNENSDPFSVSGILKYDSHKKPYLEFSAEKFIAFYELMPFEFQSYIDMLIAPSFTGESITDEEYLDLLASVYGQNLCDEIKNATIDFIFIDADAANGKKKSKMNLSLLSILNITGDFIVKS